MRKWICFLLMILLYSEALANQLSQGDNDLSPFDFGLSSAQNGIERYKALLNTHRAALKAGVNVDYSGIDTIRIEIPEKAQRIPLTQNNDFKGCVFVVKNTSRKTWLFDKKSRQDSIEVEKQQIDAGDFRSLKQLRKGRYLLVIEDENLWVKNRRGYSYGHPRKDILMVEDGIAKNTVVMPYNNDYSKPKCTFIRLKGKPLVFKNLTVLRDSECTFVTHVASIVGFDDVRISNVNIKTPESNLNADRGIRLYDCTNVTMEDVLIEGTFSQSNNSGYGINLENVWNFKAKRLYGKAKWGVFGNNNVNTVLIEDSRINRFDIHCYGKDVSFKGVEFFDLYNQYSSVYGTISYDGCTFTDFVPVLNGGSYNAYVGHEVIFKDCVINATSKKNFLFKMSGMWQNANERNELTVKCLPNVFIKNMTINMADGAKELYLFYCSPAIMRVSDIDFLSNINIDGFYIVENSETPVGSIFLSNVNMQTKRPVDCTLKNMIFFRVKSGTNEVVEKHDAVELKANMPIKRGKIRMKNVRNVVFVRSNQASLLCFSINRITIYPIAISLFLAIIIGAKRFVKR